MHLGRTRLIEVIEVHRRAAVASLQIHPAPGGVRDEHVAGQRGGRGFHLRRVGAGVQRQCTRRLRAEQPLQCRAVMRRGRRLVLQDRGVVTLLRIAPQQQRHLCLLAAGHAGRGWLAQEPAVEIDVGVAVLLARGLQQAVRRQRTQRGQRVGIEMPRERLAAALHRRQRHRRDRRDQGAAFADRAGEQPARQRRGHQRAHRDRTGRLAGDRHLRRITAESGDVGAHPAQRGDLVEQAIIARRVLRRLGGERRRGEETEHAQAIVHRDRDDAAAGQAGTVVARLRTVAGDEAAAEEIHQHR